MPTNGYLFTFPQTVWYALLDMSKLMRPRLTLVGGYFLASDLASYFSVISYHPKRGGQRINYYLSENELVTRYSCPWCNHF